MRRQVYVVQSLLMACAVVWSAEQAPAQSRLGASSSGFSPWLNLQRRDPGPLGGYLSNVRPEQRLRRTLHRQGTALQRQGAGLSALGHQMTTYERASAIRPTGTGGGFMNLSHYYPIRGAVARPQRTPAPRPPRPAMGRGMGMGGGF